MKNKLLLFSLALFVGIPLIAPEVHSGSKYYVYKKKGSNKCELTMRDPGKFKRAKGSSWNFVGKSTSRSTAKKIGKRAGCRSF